MNKHPRLRLLYLPIYLWFAIWSIFFAGLPVALSVLLVALATLGIFTTLCKAEVVHYERAKYVHNGNFDFLSIALLAMLCLNAAFLR